MLGGGTFTAQNKVLPGAYINFVSKAKATANVSDRGVAAIPLELDWGEDGKVITVTQEDFQKNCRKIFGYEYTSDKLKGLRDLFLYCQVLHTYRLNSGDKANNDFAEAKFSGVRGNDIKIVIKTNADDNSKFDVLTYLGEALVDTQTATSATELKENDFVKFNTSAVLKVTAGTALIGGTNGVVTGTQHQEFLDKIESYSFNTLGVATKDDTTLNLYVSFTKRMREEVGAKFQTVLYNRAADYEGIINVKNKCEDDETALIYWVTGVESACTVNASCLNKKYDGEFIVIADYTQSQLSESLLSGEFVLHKEGDDICVLDDINSLVTVTEEKGEDFKSNQTIRVLDQIALDIASLFKTKYLGKVGNDEDGRIAFWSDIVKYYETLQDLRAIENFNDKEVIVEQGETKNSVVVSNPIIPVNAMSKLYMVVTVA